MVVDTRSRSAAPTNLENGTVNHDAIHPLDISPSTRFGILAGVYLGSFLTALNLTLVPTMLPTISSEFNKANQGSWLGTA